MNKRNEKSQKSFSELELMARILEVRYMDMEEEKDLCKQLLELSEAGQYHYGSAFANVYLVDSHLALGEYSRCDFYLVRASLLCRQHGFDDLMLTLCNCAGLYYQKLNEDQIALSYFLEGKALADKLGDISMAGKLYNNMGYAFGYREDWETAKTYFSMAYQTVEPYLVEENIRSAVSYLTNLAEACIYTGDAAGSIVALQRCENLKENSIYSRVRLGCSWCSYYAMIEDWNQCSNKAESVESDLLNMEDQFFVCDMAVGLCANMLHIGDQERARRLLTMLQEFEYHTSLSLQHRIQSLKIRYGKKYETEYLDEAYRKYYEITSRITEIEDAIYIQSIVSKIQISQATKDHERAINQKQMIENAGLLDELTGLYNRRYFNKLVSKMIYRDDITTLGFIIMDVDCFKPYNDFYGHFEGDGALRSVAQILLQSAVDGIYASRYGGDEFVCLCINQEDSRIETYMEQVLAKLRRRKIPHEKSYCSQFLTISMGYCNHTIDGRIDTEDLLHAADQGLYGVKEDKKRNRTKSDWRREVFKRLPL